MRCAASYSNRNMFSRRLNTRRMNVFKVKFVCIIYYMIYIRGVRKENAVRWLDLRQIRSMISRISEKNSLATHSEPINTPLSS